MNVLGQTREQELASIQRDPEAHMAAVVEASRAHVQAVLTVHRRKAQPRWDHATLDELIRRRNSFTASWHECIDEMKGETW